MAWIIAALSLIASLITIITFMAQVSESGFSGNMFDAPDLRMPLIQISYQESGFFALGLLAVGMYFLLRKTSLYSRVLWGIQNEVPAPLIGAAFIHVPLGFIWAKAFWPAAFSDVTQGDSIGDMFLGFTGLLLPCLTAGLLMVFVELLMVFVFGSEE